MTIPSQTTSAPAADLLKFACSHCGSSLEVPLALAGVQGPCPLCGGVTTAPASSGQRAPGITARVFAKPPPRRDMPPPLEPVAEHPPAPKALRPLPIAAEAPPQPQQRQETEGPEISPRFPGPARLSPLPHPIPRQITPAPDTGPTSPGRLLTNTQAPAPAHRGIFGDSGSQIQEFQPPLPEQSRHGWRRWVDIGIVSVFTGLLLATIAALRFTVPVKVDLAPGLPPNLTQLVENETQRQVMREREAGELACAAVNRYLGAASEQAAASYLLPAPEGIPAPSFPPFAAQLPAEWTASDARRIPLTDRYLVTVQPAGGKPGPWFVVEQTDNGPRLHAGPVTQQSAGLFDKFTATPGIGEAMLYVKARPTLPEYERNYRADRPDLAEFRLVDLQAAFPVQGSAAFIACFKPDSAAARQFSRRAHDPGWRAALVHVRWQQHREAGPWIELVKFVPGPWSGDPPGHAASITASTSP